MKLYVIAAILGITAIVITAMVLGYDGAAVAGGVSTIAGLAGWHIKGEAVKRLGSPEITLATLKKAGYTNASLTKIANRLKSKGA